MYAIFDTVRARHPALQLENCSSGGGRTDLGTLAVQLPRAGAVLLHISGGSTTLHLPVGAAVQIRSEIKLGEVKVTAAGLVADEAAQQWASPDFVEGPDAMTVVLKGGLGTVNVQ